MCTVQAEAMNNPGINQFIAAKKADGTYDGLKQQFGVSLGTPSGGTTAPTTTTTQAPSSTTPSGTGTTTDPTMVSARKRTYL